MRRTKVRKRREKSCFRSLKDLIQRVLHHPDFNADEVDHDMHECLMRAVEDGDIEVIDMWEEGDGLQDNTFVKRKVSKHCVIPINPPA